MQVLVVDDDRDQVKSLCLGLRSRGIKALESFNGNQALSQLSVISSDIDAVITDYVMPGINGVDLLKAITKTYSGIPVIMISANGNDKLIQEALYHGCERFFEKPIDIERLVQEVRRICRVDRKDRKTIREKRD